MRAIAAGGQATMRTLYARHHLRVYHFLVRLGSDTDRVEDLVSEVFLSVWRQEQVGDRPRAVVPNPMSSGLARTFKRGAGHRAP
jgi:DNA-directed RNA polymerase specialized sigma24 family protein